MARGQAGLHDRGIGMELRRLREDRKVNLRDLGERVGMSASTLSRIENGERVASSEDIASILTGLGVVGVVREQLIDQARRHEDPELLESATSTEQSRNFLNFEENATRIVEFQPLILPGLAQTVDYATALLTALRVQDGDEDIEPWVKLRLSRQTLLTRRRPPELHWIVAEHALRRPVGGRRAMAKQVRHLADLAERPNTTVVVLPDEVAEHPGLLGQFIIMDFPEDPTVVHVEDRTTGLFLDDPDKVAVYTLSAEKLTSLALDETASLRLLRSIAKDLERD